MSLSAGPGSPVYFQCSWARKHTDWRDSRRFEGHTVMLTGRTRPYRSQKYSAMGQRSTSVSREYRCACGHVGWSNHVDLQRMAERDQVGNTP